jgi:hypothetical protein
MEGNPKAPRFHIEHHSEPPREAYHQHVSENNFFSEKLKQFFRFNYAAGEKGLASREYRFDECSAA